MVKIYEIGKHRIPNLRGIYPLVNLEEFPVEYNTVSVSYRYEEIEKYDVLLFHRLMKKNYGDPSEMECEIKDEDLRKSGYKKSIMRRTKNGYEVNIDSYPETVFEKLKELGGDKTIKAFPLEWRYFVSTTSGGIIEIGTEDKHNGLLIRHIFKKNIHKPDRTLIKEGEKFIDDLLKEVERHKGQILNPLKDFEEAEGIQLYLLDNVFINNYLSAELMMQYSKENEQEILNEFMKYDARDEEVLNDPEKISHIDKYQAAIGMYYASSISFYLMALEGFINLVYHAFLRDEFRDRELNLEQRFDLEQKIRLMPRLCNGFKNNVDRRKDYYKDFKKLKNFRNQIFHSKIVESLKSITLVEDGFIYNCDIEKYSKAPFPSRKTSLKKEDVLTIKNIVDTIIKEITNMMEKHPRSLTKKFIMGNKSVNAVPFWKDRKGNLRLGESGLNPES